MVTQTQSLQCQEKWKWNETLENWPRPAGITLGHSWRKENIFPSTGTEEWGYRNFKWAVKPQSCNTIEIRTAYTSNIGLSINRYQTDWMLMHWWSTPVSVFTPPCFQKIHETVKIAVCIIRRHVTWQISTNVLKDTPPHLGTAYHRTCWHWSSRVLRTVHM